MLKLTGAVTAYKPSIGRRRGGAKLSARESEKAITFIRQHCARVRHPVRFLHLAMGCSRKTASRLLSETRPYAAQLRRDYAVAFSMRTGYPLEAVTQPEDIDYTAAIKGWRDIGPASLATKTAALLGAGMATRSMRVYGMMADFTVTHGVDGRPAAVKVVITPAPGVDARHLLAIAESTFSGGLMLTHYGPDGSQRYQIMPHAESIDRILKTIKNEQKNITTKLSR